VPELAGLERPRPAEAGGPARARAPFVEVTGPASQHDPLTVTSEAQLLDLQRTAGNQAVVRTLQRAPAKGARRKLTRAQEFSDYSDLFTGFEALAATAVNEGGRHLDTIHFGPSLTPEHRAFVEQIRGVLILAQETSPDSKRSAIAQWPGVKTKLDAALVRGGQLGMSSENLASHADNVALVGEKYVGAAPRGPSQAENGDDYMDLVAGTQKLLGVVEEQVVDKRDAVVATNISQTNAGQRSELGAVQFGPHLTKRHRDLLENLRTALIYARTEAPGSARTAMTIWQSIQGGYEHVFKRIPTFIEFDVSPFRQEFARLGPQLFQGGVYSEAHNAALEATHLVAPDQALLEGRLKEAAEGFDQVNKFMDKAGEMAEINVLEMVLHSGHVEPALADAIFKLVKSPGEIVTLFHQFKEQGLIGKAVTLADIAEKTLALRNAAISVSCEIIKSVANNAKTKALEAGAEELAEHWGKVGEWAEGKLALVKGLSRAVLIISIAVSAIKIIDAIRRGAWGEALKEAGTTMLSIGAAVAGGGLTATAFVGGIGVIIAAEIEGISGAAAMIRWCKDQNVHDAALSFVYECQAAANIEARDLVADASLLATTKDKAERAMIEAKLASDVPWWQRHLESLGKMVSNTRATALGGQPEVRDALGSQALAILNDPTSFAANWQTMAEQIRVIFAGANAMTKYVDDKYSQKPATEGAK